MRRNITFTGKILPVQELRNVAIRPVDLVRAADVQGPVSDCEAVDLQTDLGREVEESEGEVLTVDSVDSSCVSSQDIDINGHGRGAIDAQFEKTASILVILGGAPRPFADCGERLALGDGAVCRVESESESEYFLSVLFFFLCWRPCADPGILCEAASRL
jgi:hypothetical protein